MSLYCTSTPYAFSYIQCRPIGGPGLYSVDQSDPYHALALPLGGAGHDGVVAGGVEAVVAQAARVRHVGVLVGVLGARPVGRECSPQPGRQLDQSEPEHIHCRPIKSRNIHRRPIRSPGCAEHSLPRVVQRSGSRGRAGDVGNPGRNVGVQVETI